MSGISYYLWDRKISLLFTLIFIIIFSFVYFAICQGNETMTKFDSQIFKDMKIKTGFKDNSIKLLVLADGNELVKIKAERGVSIPFGDNLILGKEEAMKMTNEGLISGVGSQLTDFFDLNVHIGGILPMTSTFIDKMHFVTESQYNAIQAEQERIFIKFKGEDDINLIMSLKVNEDIPLKLNFKEGNIESYLTYKIGSDTYYPLILGSDEAKMMREEKEFNKIGDTISDFFGHKAFVVGILEPTGTALDDLHITPLTDAELN